MNKGQLVPFDFGQGPQHDKTSQVLWMITERDACLSECRSRSGVTKDLVDFVGQGVEGEGFLEIVEVGVGKALADDGIVGITGHEDDLEVGA